MSPQQVELIAQQRAMMRRARGQGRRWILRGVLMLAVAGVALSRGGQVNVMIGVAMVFLAVLAGSMGVQMRRKAAELEAKIDLIEHTTSEELGELAG